jgi:SAM-dependent methyltransferase
LCSYRSTRCQASPSVNDENLDGRPTTENLRESFINLIEKSLQDDTFVSFTLRGPSKKKGSSASKKKKSSSAAILEEGADDILRGCIRQVQGRKIQIKGQPFLQVTFKFHLATDVAKNWPLENTINSSNKKKKSSDFNMHQSLCRILDPEGFTLGSTHDGFVPVSEWGETQQLQEGDNFIRREDLRNNLLGIQRGTLTTLHSSYEIDIGYQTKKPRIKQSKLDSRTAEKSSSRQGVMANHDRVKKVPLDTKALFLQALGVTNVQGKPKQAMASKLRQCQKFVEIVGNLVEKAYTSSTTKQPQQLSILDMGCGRGYLTFSLHSYLQAKYDTVQSTGIDIRPKLVNEINAIANSLGKEFETLTFQEGSIESMLASTSTGPESVDESQGTSSNSLDILIALHACDTATDDALWYGIARQANIIVVAPCCHKEIRPQLNAHISRHAKRTPSSSSVADTHPLADMLRHNVYRERHAEMVTDSLRALLLEIAGYQVQVFEFIGGEHTSKNVMITAIRPMKQQSQTQQQDLCQRLDELASLHGVTKQKLAHWMGSEMLGEDSALLQHQQQSSLTPRRLSARNMPAL